jgi:hypothetical protein
VLDVPFSTEPNDMIERERDRMSAVEKERRSGRKRRKPGNGQKISDDRRRKHQSG